MTMKTCFRCAAAAFATPAPAQGVAGLILLILLLYVGYSVPRPSMVGGLRWLSDINVGKYFCDSAPLAYRFQSSPDDTVSRQL